MIAGYTLKGVPETTKALQGVSKAFRGKVVATSTRGASKTLVEAAKRNAPRAKKGHHRVRPGRLKKSIRVTRQTGASGKRLANYKSHLRRLAQRRLSIVVRAGHITDIVHPGPRGWYGLFVERGTKPRRRRLRKDGKPTDTRESPKGGRTGRVTARPFLGAAFIANHKRAWTEFQRLYVKDLDKTVRQILNKSKRRK